MVTLDILRIFKNFYLQWHQTPGQISLLRCMSTSTCPLFSPNDRIWYILIISILKCEYMLIENRVAKGVQHVILVSVYYHDVSDCCCFFFLTFSFIWLKASIDRLATLLFFLFALTKSVTLNRALMFLHYACNIFILTVDW